MVRPGVHGVRARRRARADRTKPVYLEFPGWHESTAGIRDWNRLPPAVRAYLRAAEELSGCRLALVATCAGGICVERTAGDVSIKPIGRSLSRNAKLRSPAPLDFFVMIGT